MRVATKTRLTSVRGPSARPRSTLGGCSPTRIGNKLRAGPNQLAEQNGTRLAESPTGSVLRTAWTGFEPPARGGVHTIPWGRAPRAERGESQHEETDRNRHGILSGGSRRVRA